MTGRESIVIQAAHLFAQTELDPGLTLPGLETVEQMQAMLSGHVEGFKGHMVEVFKEAGLPFTKLEVPEKLWVIMAEAEAVIPEEQAAFMSAAGVLSEEELGSAGESADDFTYTDEPHNLDIPLTVAITDIQRSRRILEPLFAGKDDSDQVLALSESAVALEVWMALGGVAFEGLDPILDTDKTPSRDVFTKLAVQMGLHHEELDYNDVYSPRIRDMLIAGRQRFAGALAYRGVQYASDHNPTLEPLLARDLNLLKAVHRSIFKTQVQTGQYQGDLRQFALAYPLSDSGLVESIRILAS